MRNTRTLAACVAATTLFGLLSATPALAEPLDRGDAGTVQGDESGSAGVGPLGRSVTEVPAAQADRGEARRSADQQSGGPDAGPLVRSPRDAPAEATPTPTAIQASPTPSAIAPTPVVAATEPASVPAPAEAAPGAGSSAQPPLVIATLSDDGALVSLSDELYRSERRIVVIVEGKPVAQIQNKQTRGVTSVTPDAVEGRSLLHIPGVKPGDRMAVTEYAGSLDDGFDDSLRRTRVYTAQLGDAFPASTEAAPGAASSAQPPLVIATLSDEGALVSLSDELYRSEKRIVVIVEGKPVAQIQNKQTRGVTRVVPDVVEGRSLLYIPGVKPGDRMAVTEYAGSLDDGFDDSLRRTRVYAAQLGDAFPASTP